jgi:hypothetical protein
VVPQPVDVGRVRVEARGALHRVRGVELSLDWLHGCHSVTGCYLVHGVTRFLAGTWFYGCHLVYTSCRRINRVLKLQNNVVKSGIQPCHGGDHGEVGAPAAQLQQVDRAELPPQHAEQSVQEVRVKRPRAAG